MCSTFLGDFSSDENETSTSSPGDRGTFADARDVRVPCAGSAAVDFDESSLPTEFEQQRPSHTCWPPRVDGAFNALCGRHFRHVSTGAAHIFGQ